MANEAPSLPTFKTRGATTLSTGAYWSKIGSASRAMPGAETPPAGEKILP